MSFGAQTPRRLVLALRTRAAGAGRATWVGIVAGGALTALVVSLGAIEGDAEASSSPTRVVSRLLPAPIYPREHPMPAPQKVDVERPDDAQLGSALEQDLSALGSLSIGSATRGRLYGAVHMEESELWHLTASDRAWGTQETVTALKHAIAEVQRLHPGSHRLRIGHISRKHGGWLRPHRSHRSGRDVDLGFYYLDDSRWYVNATAENLDVPRTWALLSALFKTAEVEYVFLDRSLHPLLRARAEELGESPELIRDVFDGQHPVTQPILRHTWGHRNHLHIRFASPVAVETAKRVKSKLGRKAWRDENLLRLLLLKEKKLAKSAPLSDR